MKNILSVTITMLFVSIIFAQVPKGTVLVDNGPLINYQNNNYPGVYFSEITDTSLTSYGFGCGKQAYVRVADDLKIIDVNWHIDSIVFFGFQTLSSTTTSPFTAYTLRIWNGIPGSSTIVWGDTTTNILTNSYFSTIFRTDYTSPTSYARPIYRNVCSTTNLTLTNGTYWLDWQATGSASLTGPWQPPITITGQDSTGNAMQLIDGIWSKVVDSSITTLAYPQGFPFIIYGTKTVGINELDNESMFRLYPNPVKNELTVEVSSMMKTIKVYNLVGQIVFNAEVKSKTYKVNTSNFTNGAYFIEVETEKGFIRKKFVVSQ